MFRSFKKLLGYLMHLDFKKLTPKARSVWHKLFSLPIIGVATFAVLYAFFAFVGTPWTENLPASIVFSCVITSFIGILLLVRQARWVFPAAVAFLFLTFKISGLNTSMFLFFQNLLPFCPVSHYCVDTHFGKDVALFAVLIANTMLLFDCIVLAIGMFVGAFSLKAYLVTKKQKHN